jgi:hypothetical protein
MLKSVRIIEDGDETTLVEFYGDSESDERSFWLRGLVSLEQVARMCLQARIDQMIEDRQSDLPALTTKTKKAA